MIWCWPIWLNSTLRGSRLVEIGLRVKTETTSNMEPRPHHLRIMLAKGQ
jgi:hypothetical protein